MAQSYKLNPYHTKKIDTTISHLAIRIKIANFASAMSLGKKIGIAILVLAWVTLVVVMLAHSGVTLYNLLIVILSGFIVFVPLWKKYFNHD